MYLYAKKGFKYKGIRFPDERRICSTQEAATLATCPIELCEIKDRDGKVLNMPKPKPALKPKPKKPQGTKVKEVKDHATED